MRQRGGETATHREAHLHVLVVYKNVAHRQPQATLA